MRGKLGSDFFVRPVTDVGSGGRLAFLIPFSPAHNHRDNAVKQFETCFASLPPGIDVLYLAAKDVEVPVELERVTIRAGSREGYFRVLEKTRDALSIIEKSGGYDFVVRGNSSNYFQVPEIAAFFASRNPDEDFYGGKSSRVSEEMTPLEYPVVYAGGSGIYLSRKTYRRLIEIDIEHYFGVVDDVAIGDFLSNRSVDLIDLPRNDVTDYQVLRRSLQSRMKSWESDARTLKRFDWAHKALSEGKRWKMGVVGFGFLWSEAIFLLSKKRVEAVARLLRDTLSKKTLLYNPVVLRSE